jgi:hypothetical protein
VGVPQVLQIVREPIKVGNEAAYAALESETARACVELKCPHPHLALEPLTGPKEVWWLNFFASETDRQQVTAAFQRNRPLMAVLERNSKLKASFTEAPTDLILNYRPDLGRVAAWKVAGQRFFIITMGPELPDGPVFAAPDGKQLILQSATTREEADRLASGMPGKTTVLAIRPSWGFPAQEWIDADPEFWAPNPVMQR